MMNMYFTVLKIVFFVCRSLDAVLAHKHGTLNTQFTTDHSESHQATANISEQPIEEKTTKRRLRSHKNTEENEFIFDLGAVTATSSNSSDSGMQGNQVTQVAQMTSLSLLRQLLPMNMAVSLKTRELLQNILSWQILPSDAPVEPSMIYGSVHLSRLIVKLPDFLNATPMSDEKMKLLIQYLDCFIE